MPRTKLFDGRATDGFYIENRKLKDQTKDSTTSGYCTSIPHLG
jgi:hypothetical protein